MTAEQDFRSLFDNWPADKAQQLSDCINNYARDLVVDWMNTGKKTWHADTWLRDMVLTAIVFQVKKKFQMDLQDNCRITAQALNGRDPEGRVLTAFQVEEIVHQHQKLTDALERVAGSKDARAQ
jgi:hypothetical protein